MVLPASEREPVLAYIGLGANLGDRVRAVEQAMEAIAALPGVEATRRSPLYRTAPVDSSGDDYINAVMGISTRMPAPNLLDVLQKLEQAAGRERPWHNAPRTLDLDVLLFGSASISSPLLTVPHPRMLERAFVLWPLADVAPALVSSAMLAAVQAQRVERV